MSIIKPRTRGKQFVPCRVRLERENHETLHAYAAFIDEHLEYVVNALIDTVLAKDKAFVAWRADQTQSFAPAPQLVRRRHRGSNSTGLPAAGDAAVSTRIRERSI